MQASPRDDSVEFKGRIRIATLILSLSSIGIRLDTDPDAPVVEKGPAPIGPPLPAKFAAERGRADPALLEGCTEETLLGLLRLAEPLCGRGGLLGP